MSIMHHDNSALILINTCTINKLCFYLLLQARVNIPALSVATIKRDIASSAFTIKSGIQVWLTLS